MRRSTTTVPALITAITLVLKTFSVIRDDIVCNVKNSDCFSLMFDESTDVSVSQNLIIYIKYLSEDKVLDKQSYCTCGVQCEISLILKQSEQIHIFLHVFITVII